MQLLMKTYHIVQDLIKGKTCALFLTQEHQKKERYVPLLLSQENQKGKTCTLINTQRTSKKEKREPLFQTQEHP
jgi:hypothetical protein